MIVLHQNAELEKFQIIIYRDRREYWLDYLINKVAVGIEKATDNYYS